jgi:hypothetical protein
MYQNIDEPLNVYIATGGAETIHRVVMLNNLDTGALFDLTPAQALQLMTWLQMRQDDLREYIQSEEMGHEPL